MGAIDEGGSETFLLDITSELTGRVAGGATVPGGTGGAYSTSNRWFKTEVDGVSLHDEPLQHQVGGIVEWRFRGAGGICHTTHTNVPMSAGFTNSTVNPDPTCGGGQNQVTIEYDYRIPAQRRMLNNKGKGWEPGPVNVWLEWTTAVARPGTNVRATTQYKVFPANLVRVAPTLTVKPASVVCGTVRAGEKTTCPMAITWSAETTLEVTAQTTGLSDKCSVQVLGTRIGAAPVVLNGLERANGRVLTQDLETALTCSEPGSYDGRLLFRAVYK